LTSALAGGVVPAMPRTARKAPAGVIFHVLNRGVGREQIFFKDEDFAAFGRVMAHALSAERTREDPGCLQTRNGPESSRVRSDVGV
jgi:putative transposase